MGLTPNHLLPYPEPTDPPDVPVDIYELANRLDTLLVAADRIAALERQVAALIAINGLTDEDFAALVAAEP